MVRRYEITLTDGTTVFVRHVNTSDMLSATLIAECVYYGLYTVVGVEEA